ncbi:MAG TPA: DUF402 domain-containing protein [Anaerolineaceae bacterium]|nr:DUF402 domain-containing protein [Anaerolineaceae bacterium]
MSQKLDLHIPNPANPLKIIKHHAGSEKIYSWSGQVLSETLNMRRLNAWFNGNPGYVGKVLLEPGDRFVETYFTDRWYNFFQIYAGQSDVLKCYYFNLSRPAVFYEDRIEWEDLALDLIVYPDGQKELIDQDEFARLNIDEKTRQICWQTLTDLLQTNLTRFESS